MTIALSGYTITAEIHSGVSTVIYRGYDDRRSVVIKVLKSEYPTLEEITGIRQEYQIGQNLDCQRIVKTYGLEKHDHGYALILEDFGGVALAEVLDSSHLSLEECLQIAIAIAEALKYLHQAEIVHKDIKPSNIIINQETGEVKLADFSIASRLSMENATATAPSLLEGTLAYIAPEQTGRMNRVVDYRSDFYALGATLYEMLTGKVPFTATDPIELVHCHITKYPTPPHEVNPEIPAVVSQIAQKLLAKTAEDRYQSAAGLKYDLETCLQHLQTTGKIASFPLGKRDKGYQLLIPQKLYGRDREVRSVLEAFNRSSDGTAQMLLVSGYSGIGKTRIVNEVHKPIVAARGYFISGKFDQFKRDIPYAAIIQAFSDLSRQLLTESQKKIDVWCEKLKQVLGENGQVIIDVIPEVEFIVGKQPEVPQPSSPSEAQNRLNRVFLKFIGVFCQKEHPLVLFLDDLQWADSASLKLLELLMSDGDSQYLLTIGAYRDNEVFGAHPLIQTIEKITASGRSVENIVVAPLKEGHVSQLIADTFKTSTEGETSEGSLPLARLLFHKTGGNPFFLTQLLKTLYSENLLSYSVAADRWEWDIAEIQAVGITDYNVVELMARNIERLSPTTQQVLKLAACIGNQFSLDMLAIANSSDTTSAATYLWEALQVGLLLPAGGNYKIPLLFGGEASSDETPWPQITNSTSSIYYKFLHDRVQQAAYSLIPESEKKQTHLRIGFQLLANTTPQQLRENIFALVNQLNHGVDLVTDVAEKEELAELNIIASQKAKAAAAYEASLNYIKVSLALLGTDGWQRNYELTRTVYLEAVEAEYLNSNFDRSQTLAEVALQQGKTILEKVRVRELQLLAYIAQNQWQTALEQGLQVLEMLGVTLQQEAPPIDKISELADLPEMTEPERVAALRILKAIADPAYVVNPELFSPIIFTQVHLCIKYGNSPLAAIAYAYYSVACVAMADIDGGYEFGKLSLKLLDKFNVREYKSIVLNAFNGYIRHWKEHVREILEPLQNAVQSGWENGELIYSGYAALHYLMSIFFLGSHLEYVEEHGEKYAELFTKQKLVYHVTGIKYFQQALLNLLGKSESAVKLIGTKFNESEIIPILQEEKNFTNLFLFYTYKILLLYLFKQSGEAVEKAKLIAPYAISVAGMQVVAQHNFYYSLALLAHYPGVDNSVQEEYLRQVAANQEKMGHWAQHAPSNFQHKYDLVEAERARVRQEYVKALEYYEQGITGARKQEYTHEEALGNELAGEFHLSWGHENMGRFYIIESYYGYIRWGAKAKVKDLESRYPELLSVIKAQKILPADKGTVKFTATRATIGMEDVLNFATVLKASQAISSEIVVDKLLAKLIQIVVENAGAQVGVLILERAGKLVIEAVLYLSTDEVVVGQSIPVEESDIIPISAINYVARTQTDVVSNNVAEDGIFAADPYMQLHQPKSILCLPIVNQGKLHGILYLENNLIAGAFTTRQIEIIKILCSQATISLENARLYSELQSANAALLKYLADLKQTQLQLVQSEKMSSLGQLAAGVAHEINNPVGFIANNINHASGYVRDMLKILAMYQHQFPEPGAEIAEEIEAVDLEFLKEDLPDLLKSMQTGTDRIREISKSMRTFSRSDSDKKVGFNIHEGLDSTLLILQHRLKADQNRPAIEIVKVYGDLPEVMCYPGQLNQVFTNLIANAIDAFEEYDRDRDYAEIKANPNRITIRTEVHEENPTVIIGIKDNGAGMSEEVKQKLFDHLFTTKPPGKGTGLGLSISRQIIVEKHGGTLSVVSELGKGAEFVMEIPLA